MKINKRRLVSSIRDLNIKGSGKVAKYLSRALLPNPKGEITIETLYGFKLKIDPVKDSGVEKSLYYYGTYEKGTLDVMGEILKQGDTFVDVGANIGLMSIFASYKVGSNGSVVAFEPNPATRSIFKENIRINDISNIIVEDVALSDQNKKSKIYDRWDVNRGGASLIKPLNASESYEIKEIRFSDYFKNNTQIKLIKIDVEGYELNVLKGANSYITSSVKPPALIVEFSSLRTNSHGEETLPLFYYLKDLSNYRFFKSAVSKERKSKLIEIKHESDIPNHDNVFCLTDNQIKELPSRIFH